MSTKLQRYKLSSLIDVKRGQSLSGNYYASEGEHIRLTLANFDYINGGFKSDNQKDDLFYTGPIKPQCLLKKGDIITPLTEQALGLLGSTALIPESDKYVQSGDIGLVTCKEGLIDPTFCYYLLSSKQVKKQLAAGSQQTKIRHTSPDAIKACIVDVPDFEQQKKIGKFLSLLDRKISLNRAINQNLEALAKQLYDYWFVQFDFPNEEGKPYKSSGGAMVWNEKLKREIPEGWEAVPLSQVMDYEGGSQPPASEFIYQKQEGYVRFVQIRDYYSGSHITYIPVRNSNKLCSETDIMIARYGASLGRICFGLKGAYNVALAKVTPKKEEYEEFLRTYLMSNVFYNKINSIGLRAAQAGFNKEDLENILIPFPIEDSVIAFFQEKMEPNFLARLHNGKENKAITRQRDELLPLLMNGQVTIE